jgi:formylglycine-generating enzyme required for sulfatase activity
MRKPTVFISYCHADRQFVDMFADRLKASGVNVWIDKWMIKVGDSITDKINEGIGASDWLILVLSRASVKSKWVRQEMNAATIRNIEQGKHAFLLPALIEECDIPQLLQDRKYANFKDDPEQAFQELLEVIQPEADSVSARQDSDPKLIHIPPGEFRMGVGWTGYEIIALVALLIAVVSCIGAYAAIPGIREAFTSFGIPSEEANEAPLANTPAPDTPTRIPSTPPPDASLGDTWSRPSDGMEMVYVPGGTFEMGSTDGDSDEQPVHSVTLDSFWIDRTEVTNAQYARCVANGICSPRSKSSSPTRDSYYGDSQYDAYPVIYVNWSDATTYCEWAGGRLPTEAQWEYAARGPDGHIYPWGDNLPDDTLVNYNFYVGDTTEVGSYPDGVSWVGALDMAGNVWEWVNDWYDGEYYASSPPKNPRGPGAGDWRMVRGGSWHDDEENVRAAYRLIVHPDDRTGNNGFRCVVEPGN